MTEIDDRFIVLGVDDKPTCKSCIYYDQSVYRIGEFGECRISPPDTDSLATEIIRFPLVKETNWCGKGNWLHEKTMSSYSGVLFWQFYQTIKMESIE
jgi:hypothetical protein